MEEKTLHVRLGKLKGFNEGGVYPPSPMYESAMLGRGMG